MKVDIDSQSFIAVNDDNHQQKCRLININDSLLYILERKKHHPRLDQEAFVSQFHPNLDIAAYSGARVNLFL